MYDLTRDSYDRICAEIAEGVVISIKLLSETDPCRIERGEHGYGVLDLSTPLGIIRIRDIRIKWSEPSQRFQLRWRQWETGKIRDARREYLDVAGPQDQATRRRFSEKILEVFSQIKEQAADGTLGNPSPQMADLNPEPNPEKAVALEA